MSAHHAMDQGTEEWLHYRLGKATASRVADIVAKTKSGPSASRAKYAAQLVCERMTGQREEGFTSAAMAWGTEHEDDARRLYAFVKDVEVTQVGFVDHPGLMFSGASPDGLVGSDGLLEIKAPDTHTHIETLLNDKVADRYVVQIMWQLACTGRAWADFVSYDPRMPEAMRLYVRRFPRDAERIAELEREVATFLSEVDRTVDSLKARYMPANDSDAANILRAE